MLNVGVKAPEFKLPDQNGVEHSLSEYKGMKVILYFYPKDNTSGCTSQACSLRDGYSELRKNNIEVIGVSVDDQKSHKKFVDKYELPFPLIADTDKKLVELFGVWGEKKMYGRTYFGTYRTTFVIDETGTITHILQPKQIKTKEHADQLLQLLTK